MSEPPRPTPIIPGLRYADAAAAIDWLCDAFGFERHLVVPGEDGTIAHAQLTFAGGMVMLGSTRDDELGKVLATPSQVGGASTQSCYVVVPDADAHYRRAIARGAKIVLDLEDHGYGGRGYSCRDLEGNLWHFGTYDPWADG